MSYMKNKLIDIIEMLGEGYSVDDVVSFTGIPYADILNIASEYGMEIKDMIDYDDSMDGDFDTAMASAGFGTDEDYGYYGDDF